MTIVGSRKGQLLSYTPENGVEVVSLDDCERLNDFLHQRITIHLEAAVILRQDRNTRKRDGADVGH